MVRLSFALRFHCPDMHDAGQVHQTMMQSGLELAGFQPQQVEWIVKDNSVYGYEISLDGEFSPVPFLALYRLVSLWCIVLEMNYEGVVTLPDGEEFEIEGDASFIDNSWSHSQYSGVYANGREGDE